MSDYSLSDMNATPIMGPFLLPSRNLLDFRTKGATLDWLDFLVNNKMATSGLEVWIDEEKSFYVYDGTVWYKESNRGSEVGSIATVQNYTKEDVKSILDIDLSTSRSSVIIWDQYPVANDITDDGNGPTNSTIISGFGEVFYFTYFVPTVCNNDYLTWTVASGLTIEVDNRLSSGTVTTESGRINFAENAIYRVKIIVPSYPNDGTDDDKSRTFAISLFSSSIGEPTIIQLGSQKMLI